MVSCFFAFGLITPQAPSPSSYDLAKREVARAIQVLGGREKLASIRQVTTTGSGHEHLVEQSERPAGPYVTTYFRGNRSYDFDAVSESTELTVAGPVYGDREFKRKARYEMGRVKSGMPLECALSHRRMALGPERVLLVADAAKDLALGKPTLFNGVSHQVLTFTWGKVPVKVFLKSASGALSGIETTSALPFPWNVWGDVPIVTRWGNWQVTENGVMEPNQFTTEINGYPVSDETVLTTQVTLNPGRVVGSEPVPLPKEDAAAMVGRYRAVKVVEGITQYQGPFNTFVIEQPDGLLVFEPVMTPAFASAFYDRLKKENPGKRVKAVVATDDAWPHFGGIRTFVARDAELILLDLNVPIVDRICKSDHATVPDELAARPRRAKIRRVHNSLVVGKGANQFVLYPVGGQGSERMLMAYFPQHRLLYGSDLLQKQGAGFFFPAYPKELAEAVTREKLPVDTVFAEHLGPTPWTVVTDFLAKL